MDFIDCLYTAFQGGQVADSFIDENQGQIDQTAIFTDDPETAEELYSMSIDDMRGKVFTKNKIPKLLKKFIDNVNIAENLSDDDLSKIAHVVIEGAHIDENSFIKWDNVRKEIYQLIGFEGAAKNIPWEGAANVNLPLLHAGAIQFNADLMPNIIRDDKVVKVASFVRDDVQHTVDSRAQRIGAHMSWQNIVQSDHWVKDTDKASFLLYFVGLLFRKSFFNSIEGRYDTELCLPEDILINSNVQSVESAARITHIQHMSTNELIENMRMGLFVEYPIEDLSFCVTDEGDNPKFYSDNTNDNKIAKSFSADNKQDGYVYDYIHEIYEQHRYLDLDGDGYQEPYIVTVHKASEKVLRIVARYDESSFEYNDSGNFVKINPVHYFTDYHLIPNPDGSFHSIGMGMLLLHANAAVNKAVNELLNAATLANNPCGLVGNALRLPKGTLSFKPGEFKQVWNTSGENIEKNVFLWPTKEPSQTLFVLFGYLVDFIKSFTNISGMRAEEKMPPNMPATNMIAIIEQGQKIYNSILYRIYDSLKREFTKQYEINKKYLDKQEQFPMAQSMGIVYAQDYLLPNYGIYPSADVKVSTSMQRMAQGQALLQLINMPQVNVREIIKNYLEIIRVDDPEQYLVHQDPNAPPSLEEQALAADISRKKVEILDKIAEKDLEALKLGIEEMKVKSQSAYYEVDSISKLSELEQKVPLGEIRRAAVEKEALTRETQLQDVTPEIHGRLSSLENLVAQSLDILNRQFQQQTQMPQMPQMPQTAEPAASPEAPEEEMLAEQEEPIEEGM